MKPTTIEQIRVSQIALRPLTDRENKLSEKISFQHLAFYNGKTAQCTECGNVWQLGTYNQKTTICPRCGKRLCIERTAKRHSVDYGYFCLVQRHQEYQIFRYFLVQKRHKKGLVPRFYTYEICRKFYNTTNRKTTTFAKSYQMFWTRKRVPFNLWSQFSIQREKYGYYLKYNFGNVPKIVASLHPQLKKRGFRGSLCGCTPADFFKKLQSPIYETLLKQHQFSAFVQLQPVEAERFFPIIKVANRHGYKIADFSLWRDLISALLFCGKDTRNPQFICPKELKTAHDFWCQRRRLLREKQQIVESLAKAKLLEKSYQSEKKPFFGIVLKGKNLTISPLKSVQEFAQEGVAMHHCVFSNEYYNKKNSLILSAKDTDNHRLATIELSLDTLDIVQCRAACNAIPERDKEIRSLVQRNLHLFKVATA